MMLRRLFADKRGSTVIEFAFALPVLAMLMLGILQYGIVLHASGGLRHALGEGIRYAKVHPEASEAIVLQKTKESLVEIGPTKITSLTFVRGRTNGAQFGRLHIDYEITPLIPFLPIETIALSETRTSYLPS